MLNEKTAAENTEPVYEVVSIDECNALVPTDDVESGRLIAICDDGRPHIVDYEKFVELNERLRAMALSYRFDGDDDERKRAKKFCANMNKYKDALNRVAKSYKTEFFSQLDAEVAALMSDASAIRQITDDGVKRADEEFRSARRQELVEQIENTIIMEPALEGIDPELFISPEMCNRTANMNQVREALDKRVTSVSQVMSRNMMPEFTVGEIISALSQSSYDVFDALSYYDAEVERRKEAAILAAARKEEAERRAAEAAGKCRLVIELSKDDRQAALDALSAAGIEFKLL